MYNSNTPSPDELPSSSQLLRSTALAVLAAVVLLMAVVLPAEYGIDPTGVGSVLRLTEMGQIKQQLATDAATPSAAVPPAPAAITAPQAPAPIAEAAQAAPWRDEMSLTLTPGEGVEVKLRMQEGDQAQYSWVVEGGAVNFDTHGDGGGRSISYEKERGAPADEGTLVAAFTGNHGWYWRNRGQADVKLVLRTRGTYSDIKRAI